MVEKVAPPPEEQQPDASQTDEMASEPEKAQEAEQSADNMKSGGMKFGKFLLVSYS